MVLTPGKGMEMVSRRGEEGFASGGVWARGQDAAVVHGEAVPSRLPLFSSGR